MTAPAGTIWCPAARSFERGFSGEFASRLGHEAGFNLREVGIITDNKFGDARIIGWCRIKLSNTCRKRIADRDRFSGYWDREVTTLGRGGSDTTACALGSPGAGKLLTSLRMWKGLDRGSANRAEARLLDSVTYYEIHHLARGGRLFT